LHLLFDFFLNYYPYIIIHFINLLLIIYIKYDCDSINVLFLFLKNLILSFELIEPLYKIYLDEKKRIHDKKIIIKNNLI